MRSREMLYKRTTIEPALININYEIGNLVERVAFGGNATLADSGRTDLEKA